MNLDLLNNKFKQLNILEDKINYEFKPFKNKLIYKKINNSNNKNLTSENYVDKNNNKNNNKIKRHLYFKDIKKEFVNEITCFGFSPFIMKKYKEQKENNEIMKYNLNLYNKGFYNYIKKKLKNIPIHDIEYINNSNLKNFNNYTNRNNSEEKIFKNLYYKNNEDKKIHKEISENKNLNIDISNNQNENSYENIKISSHSITNEGEGKIITKIINEKPKNNFKKILYKKKLKLTKSKKKLILNIDNNINKISNTNNNSLNNIKKNLNNSKKKILFNKIYKLRNNLHPLTSIVNKKFFFDSNNYNSPKNNTLYKNFFMNNYNNSAKNIFNKNNKINTIKCFDYFIDEKYKNRNFIYSQEKISKTSRKEKETNNNKLYNINNINKNNIKFYSCKNILKFKNRKKIQMDSIFNSTESIFNKKNIKKNSTIVFIK